MPVERMRFVVVQDGARLGYAMARAIKRAGMLAGLYTDWYNDGSPAARGMIALARRLRPARAVRMALRRAVELEGVPIYDAKLLGGYLAATWPNSCGTGWFWRGIDAVRRVQLFARGPLAPAGGHVDAVLAFTHMLSPAACRRLPVSPRRCTRACIGFLCTVAGALRGSCWRWWRCRFCLGVRDRASRGC